MLVRQQLLSPAPAGPESGSRARGEINVTDMTLERKQTGWDIALGVLLLIAGIIILGNAVLATVASVVFIGWLALGAGLVGIVASLFRIGKDGFWSTALGGGLLTVLGVMILRYPDAAILTLTLVAGALFLATGVTRIIAAFEFRSPHWPLLISGLFSLALGLIVLFNVVEASLFLLGILVGVQVLIDGVTLLLVGRSPSRRPEGLAA